MQRKPKTINKKRLVRYKEGAEMYSMGMNKFCRQGKRFWFNQNSLDFWLNRKYNDYEMDGGVYCG